MCQLLVMGNEETLGGFPVKTVVPALVSPSLPPSVRLSVLQPAEVNPGLPSSDRLCNFVFVLLLTTDHAVTDGAQL